MMYRPAKTCNLWAMREDQIAKLQRGQWVYCCDPSRMEYERPSRFYGVTSTGSVWVIHWGGPREKYSKWDSLMEAWRSDSKRGRFHRKLFNKEETA
jgi:hypothetical protein